MNVRMKKLSVAVATVLTLVAVVPAEAQRGGPPAGGRRGQAGQDRAELELRVRQRMGEMMRRQLGLNEEQGEAIAEVVRSFDERRRELGREGQAIRRRVEALTLEGGDDADEAQELVTRMGELRRQEVQLFLDEQEALLEVLTPMQLLRFQAFREEMGERIRRLRQGRGNGGPGWPPGLS